MALGTPTPPPGPTSPEGLAWIEKLAGLATRGPWASLARTYFSEPRDIEGAFIPRVCEEGPDGFPPLTPENAEFIAAARTYVPESVTELRRLNAALAYAAGEARALAIENGMLKAQIARAYTGPGE